MNVISQTEFNLKLLYLLAAEAGISSKVTLSFLMQQMFLMYIAELYTFLYLLEYSLSKSCLFSQQNF